MHAAMSNRCCLTDYLCDGCRRLPNCGRRANNVSLQEPFHCSLPLAKGAIKAALYCAQHSHPPNPERAETRSCPKRAQFHRARSASKKGTWSLPPHSPFFKDDEDRPDHHGKAGKIILFQFFLQMDNRKDAKHD